LPNTVLKKGVESLKNSLPLLYLILGLFALRSSVVEPYVVPTGSMEPTLKPGDRLYALKCAYDLKLPFTNWTLLHFSNIKRGDVILFQAPHRPEMTYVKRAVGLPGDRLEFRDGVLYVNGEEVSKAEFPNRDILYDIERNSDKRLYVENLTGRKHFVILDSFHDGSPRRSMETLIVPENHFFAVGDNRDNSYDSREWPRDGFSPFVPMENLKGKAMFIWFSGWDPLLKENMIKEHSLIGQIFYFVVDFFRFIFDWARGDAHVRFEKIGTLIQ